MSDDAGPSPDEFYDFASPETKRALLKFGHERLDGVDLETAFADAVNQAIQIRAKLHAQYGPGGWPGGPLEMAAYLERVAASLREGVGVDGRSYNS